MRSKKQKWLKLTLHQSVASAQPHLNPCKKMIFPNFKPSTKRNLRQADSLRCGYQDFIPKTIVIAGFEAYREVLRTGNLQSWTEGYQCCFGFFFIFVRPVWATDSLWDFPWCRCEFFLWGCFHPCGGLHAVGEVLDNLFWQYGGCRRFLFCSPSFNRNAIWGRKFMQKKKRENNGMSSFIILDIFNLHYLLLIWFVKTVFMFLCLYK